MRYALTLRTCRLLDIQGFDSVDVQELAPVAPWLRLAFGLCALLGGVGTVLASPTILLVLTPFAAVAAASPVHPFDLIYNYGIRHLTGTGLLPRRGVPSRFACGIGAVLLLVTAWAFSAGHVVVGYALGGMLTFVALLVSTTDICLPSMIYRSIFGWPRARDAQQKDDRRGENAAHRGRRAPAAPSLAAKTASASRAPSKYEGFKGPLRSDAAIFR